MSHTSKISSIKIQSIPALRKALLELNKQGVKCTLEENASPRAYSVNQAGLGKADYVIRLPDARFDVGLYKDEKGCYEARTDFFLGSVEKVLGVAPSSKQAAEQAKLGKLFQRYSLCAAEESARSKGLMCRRIEKANGLVQLELTGVNL